MSDRTQTAEEVLAMTGDYCASYVGGPLDNEGGFVDNRDPIRMEGGEYRWLETGSDGDAVFEWQETVSLELAPEDAEAAIYGLTIANEEIADHEKANRLYRVQITLLNALEARHA